MSWILKTRGLRGFYTGLVALAYRDIPTFGLYTVVYESLHKVIQKSPYSDKQGVIAAIFAGGTAGVVAWGCCLPMDCIKSRLQADQVGRYKGILDCSRQIYAQRGFRAFYDGLLVNSVRAFFVNAITFLVYSRLLRELNNYSRKSRENLL